MTPMISRVTIRRRNFSSQPCYCCGKPGSPDAALHVTMFRDDSNVRAKVIVPRCRHCMKAEAPVIKIAIACAMFVAACDLLIMSGIKLWIMAALTLITAFLAFLLTYMFLLIAFRIVYKSSTSDYDVVRYMSAQGWMLINDSETSPAKQLSNEELEELLAAIGRDCDCEIAKAS